MSKTKLALSATMISFFTLSSKILGFSREIMIAFVFGTTMETDSYFIAMTATVFLMGAIWAALNSTLIPLFSEIEERHGIRGKYVFFNNFLNIIIFYSILLAILAYFLSPFIIKILAKEFKGEQLQLAVHLNRIGLPIIVLLAVNYVISAFLHVNQIFGPPAMSGIPFNLVFLIFLGFFSKTATITQLMIVSVFAILAQVLILLPSLKRLNYRYRLRLNFKDRYIKRIWIMILPVLIGSSVQQINTIIDKTLASTLVEGSITALTYSAKINDMVISVFIMAITTVIFPLLSRSFIENDIAQIKLLAKKGINIILIITIPASIGLMILSVPIVRIFFERGAFTELSTALTSSALFYYTLGLSSIALNLMFNKLFYSLHETKLPMIIGFVGVLINCIFNFALISSMKIGGLALATSISNISMTILLYVFLRRKIGGFNLLSCLITCLKSLFSAVIMGCFVYYSYFHFVAKLSISNKLNMLLLLLSILLAVLMYFSLCFVLNVQEVRKLVAKVLKR